MLRSSSLCHDCRVSRAGFIYGIAAVMSTALPYIMRVGRPKSVGIYDDPRDRVDARYFEPIGPITEEAARSGPTPSQPPRQPSHAVCSLLVGPRANFEAAATNQVHQGRKQIGTSAGYGPGGGGFRRVVSLINMLRAEIPATHESTHNPPIKPDYTPVYLLLPGGTIPLTDGVRHTTVRRVAGWSSWAMSIYASNPKRPWRCQR
jgi:hypothetical protein